MIGEIIVAIFAGLFFIGLPVGVFLNGHKKEGIIAGLVLIPGYIAGLSMTFFPSISLLWTMFGLVLFGMLLAMIVSKDKPLIWVLSLLFVGGVATMYGSLIKGDEWFIFKWPWTVIVIGIWLLVGFPLGILGWGKGRGAGGEKEEVIKHYKPGLTDYKYVGKSIRRGNEIKHYDASGRYKGKSKV